MSEVICHSILDDLVAGPDVFETIYVGTMEEQINIYDPDSKIGCYVSISAIDKAQGQIRVGRILVAEYVKGAGSDPGSVAKEILFDAANLVATYAQVTLEDLNRSTQVVRGIVAIPRGLLWPSAIANFMEKGDNGRWHRVFSIEA